MLKPLSPGAPLTTERQRAFARADEAQRFAPLLRRNRLLDAVTKGSPRLVERFWRGRLPLRPLRQHFQRAATPGIQIPQQRQLRRQVAGKAISWAVLLHQPLPQQRLERGLHIGAVYNERQGPGIERRIHRRQCCQDAALELRERRDGADREFALRRGRLRQRQQLGERAVGAPRQRRELQQTQRMSVHGSGKPLRGEVLFRRQCASQFSRQECCAIGGRQTRQLKRLPRPPITAPL